MGWCSRVWLHAALSLCVQVDSPDMGWRSGGEGVPEMGIHSKMWPRTVLSLHGQVENSGAVLGHQDHHSLVTLKATQDHGKRAQRTGTPTLEVNCAPHCCLSRDRMERSWSSEEERSCSRRRDSFLR
eukprot:1160284-Pelagomonas_calceolata.AAC.8